MLRKKHLWTLSLLAIRRLIPEVSKPMYNSLVCFTHSTGSHCSTISESHLFYSLVSQNVSFV